MLSDCAGNQPVDASAIAYLISLHNRCRFCAVLHESSLHSSGHGGAATAIRTRAFDSINPAGLKEAVLWSCTGFGRPKPDWVAAAYTTHFTNRVANAVALPAPPGLAPKPLRRWMAHRTAGASLLRPAANPVLPAGLAAVVAHRVHTHVSAWRGEDPGPNRGWVENYLADLSLPDRAAARLALLTALASHQVDHLVREAFCHAAPDSLDILSVIRWGASLGARRAIDSLQSGVVIAAA
ncbi:MAG: hypothetical protein JNK48_19285 [Bryobacterales bacterium]|nr:hypothetical protein [Bryobacterales bacterium]